MIPRIDAHAAFPFGLHWDADQLAAAMPTRLRLVDTLGDIRSLADLAQPAANTAVSFRRHARAGYATASTLPERFRIR